MRTRRCAIDGRTLHNHYSCCCCAGHLLLLRVFGLSNYSVEVVMVPLEATGTWPGVSHTMWISFPLAASMLGGFPGLVQW